MRTKLSDFMFKKLVSELEQNHFDLPTESILKEKLVLSLQNVIGYDYPESKTIAITDTFFRIYNNPWIHRIPFFIGLFSKSKQIQVRDKMIHSLAKKYQPSMSTVEINVIISCMP